MSIMELGPSHSGTEIDGGRFESSIDLNADSPEDTLSQERTEYLTRRFGSVQRGVEFFAMMDKWRQEIRDRLE